MRTPLKSLEELMPFPSAAELLAGRRDAVEAIAPGATAHAALERMAQRDIGLVVVLEGGKLVGVISERDIARRVLLNGRASRETPVREIMTFPVHTVAPEAKVPACIGLMHEKGVRHLPVTSAGRVLGVLSVRDLMGALIQRHERLLRRLQEERITLLFPDPSSY